MAVKMGLFWFCFGLFAVISIDAKGQLHILYSPNSLEFSGSGNNRESMLKEVLFAALGLSPQEYGKWDGMYMVNPFSTPEAVVVVNVAGVTNFDSFESDMIYSVAVDEIEFNAFEEMKDRAKRRAAEGNTFVDINISDLQALTDALGDVSVPSVPKRTLSHLEYTVDEDVKFLSELDALKAVTASISRNHIKADSSATDFYNLRFTTLHALSDFHGAHSEATAEAKVLLSKQIRKLEKMFKRTYDGRVLVTVVCTDVAHTRRTVRAADEEAPIVMRADAIHITRLISEDPPASPYPPIFNICLWLGLLLIFALMAIVYAFLDMDPGRDSIIYRMTSTGTKKEN